MARWQKVPSEGLKDGLYRVTTSHFCAGFIVKDGRVTDAAPILRGKLAHWVTVATWIAP